MQEGSARPGTAGDSRATGPEHPDPVQDWLSWLLLASCLFPPHGCRPRHHSTRNLTVDKSPPRSSQGLLG